ncbi:MAG: hypothetical protein ACD_21C00191G0001 [uncultured bacterium]|nr:MAG: hypothetical protein ACD_21C00191G0001 [uncultured bacterium]
MHLGTNLRQIFGDDILAQVVQEDILTAPHDLWVVDGVRYISEHEILAQVPDYYLLNITAPIELRWQRTRQRQEKVDEATMTLAEFTEREHDKTEQQISAVQAQASFTINNTGSFQDLYNKIDQWLLNVRHIG